MTDEGFTEGPDVAPTSPDDGWQTLATDDSAHAPRGLGEQHPAEPKRRRGRPPKDPGAPPTPRRPRTTSTRRGASIKDQIGGTLLLLNLAFGFMPDPWRGDALDDVEIMALAEALDDAARANPTIHRMLSTVLVDGGAMANLAIVGALIAGRRLARHGMLPEDMDDRLGTFLAAKMGKDATAA